MTSTAYGTSRDSIAAIGAEGTPGQTFFAAIPFLEGMPDEEGLTPHTRPEGSLWIG